MGVGLQVYFNHNFFGLGKPPMLCTGKKNRNLKNQEYRSGIKGFKCK
jgi:hypothetical protein